MHLNDSFGRSDKIRYWCNHHEQACAMAAEGYYHPLFHQLERRAETQIFLCVLAYHLLVAIKKRLLDQRVHISWDSVREVLSTHHINTVALPTSSGDVLRIRKGSTPEPEVRELCDLLGVPHALIDPIKTWNRKKHSDGKSKSTLIYQ